MSLRRRFKVHRVSLQNEDIWMTRASLKEGGTFWGTFWGTFRDGVRAGILKSIFQEPQKDVESEE
jgi:hypothetical protein